MGLYNPTIQVDLYGALVLAVLVAIVFSGFLGWAVGICMGLWMNKKKGVS